MLHLSAIGFGQLANKLRSHSTHSINMSLFSPSTLACNVLEFLGHPRALADYLLIILLLMSNALIRNCEVGFTFSGWFRTILSCSHCSKLLKFYGTVGLFNHSILRIL